MIVDFKFDKEKDVWNIWNTCNSGTSYGHDFTKNMSKGIIDLCKGKSFEKSKKDLLKRRRIIYDNFLLMFTNNSFSKGWLKIEKEYFRRLAIITKRKINFNKVYAYLTTASKCPYNPNKKPPYFYINFFANIPNALHTIGHELMHIHLHNSDWWKNIENKIGYDKTHDLKEALTILLDLEFVDLWIVQEKGYPNHEKLRRYIAQQWKKKKDFNELTDNCVKWIKRNGVK